MRQSYAKNESLCLPLELSGGYSHTRATLGEPTFPAFPYKTWQTVCMRNERLVRIDALLLLGTRSGRGSRRPASEDGYLTLLAGLTFLHFDAPS